MSEAQTSDPISTRETRELACRLAAQVCQGQSPAGTALLSYIVLFENYIDVGATETGAMMGWEVVERPPVVLAEVRARMKDRLA